MEQFKPSILVLMAAWNEEEGIGLTLRELKKAVDNCHFLVVDGNSVDKTVDVANRLGADVLFQEGKGKGDAIAYGLQHLSNEYDYIALIDADYTYPARSIPKMIDILEVNPQIGMVCGNRFSDYMRANTMHNYLYFGNRAIAFVHNILNGIELKDPLTGLRVIRFALMKKWQPKSHGFDVEVELNHHIERQGFNIKEIDIPFRRRLGEKKLKARHGLTILRRIIMETVN